MDEQNPEGMAPEAPEGIPQEGAPAGEAPPAPEAGQVPTDVPADLGAEDPEAAMAAAMAAEMGLDPAGNPLEEGVPEGVTASFEELGEAIPGSEPAALALLYDLDLPVSIELGRTRLSVQEVLGLGRGSVVQLERQAGEPVDVYVGDRRFAEGEVVIVGEQFGVRITRIVSTTPIGQLAKV